MKLLSALKFPFMSTPADPEANTGLVYFKSDGNLYKKVGSTEAVIGGGYVNVPTTWSSATTYNTNELVGMAGKFYRASQASTNKPPVLYGDYWLPLYGDDYDVWSQKDGSFVSNNLAAAWDAFWKTGTSAASLTTTAGEFETGRQALKVVMGTSSGQRLYEKEENVVADGEMITTRVRAKLTSAAAGVTIDAILAQNDQTADPVPLASNASFVNSLTLPQTLTTTWMTYEFTNKAIGGKPRAMMEILLNTAAAAATVVIDRVEIFRGTAQALGTAGLRASNSTGISTANGAWTMYNLWAQDSSFPSSLKVTSNGFQATESGFYNITADGIWASSGAGRRAIMVDIAPTETEGLNLSRPFLQQYSTPGLSAGVINLSGSVYIPAGYWVRMWSMQESGAALTFGIDTSVTLLRAVKVSAGSGGPEPSVPPYVQVVQSGSPNSTSTTPVTLYSIAIPGAGTWDVSYSARAQTPASGAFFGVAALYNQAGTMVPNSEILPWSINGSAAGATTSSGRMVITTTGPETYTVRGWSGGAYTIQWATDGNGRAGGVAIKMLTNAQKDVPPSLGVVVSGAQAIPALTWTLFNQYSGQYPTVQGPMSYSGGWITVPVSGLYMVTVSQNFNSNTTRRILAVLTNTTANVSFQQELGDAVAQSMTTGGMIRLVAGDKVGMGIYVASAQSTYAGAGVNTGVLQVAKISD